MKTKYLAILAAVFFMGSLPLHAHSPQPQSQQQLQQQQQQQQSCSIDKTPESPQIPDGNVAGFTQMAQARLAVVDYIEQTKKHLHCVKNNYRHDLLVTRLHRVAREFNRELKTYKSKFENS